MTGIVSCVGAAAVLLLVAGCGPAGTNGDGLDAPSARAEQAAPGTATDGAQPGGQPGPGAPRGRQPETAPPQGGDTAAPQPRPDRHDTGDDVHELAEDAESVGQRHADAYAGLELEGDRVRIFRVPDPELDAALRALAGGDRLLLSDADHSRAELQRVQERVEQDAGHWRRAGLTFTTLGVRHDGSAVEVGVAEARRVAEVRRALEERYGAAAPIRVVEAGPVVPLGLELP